MTWQHARLKGGQLEAVPEDGVAVSNHPPGWLGKRWRRLIDQASRESKDRVRRGKNYARRGRLRALSTAPGVATAEVVCEESFRPSVRVRPFARTEWKDIVRELTDDLNLITSLMEGELPDELVSRLDERGIHLLPTFDELSFDCDCGDFVMPCSHVATVFHVLTDALDGDPFLLLTLRGRDRESLLATLRSDWGDDAPLTASGTRTEEPVPDGDWWSGEPPDVPCHWGADPVVGAGVRALGPPPGAKGLLQTLLPLYEGGHAQVREMLESIPDRPVPRWRRRVAARRAEALPEELQAGAADDVEAEGVAEEPAAPAASVKLTNRLVAVLADGQGHTSKTLAQAVDVGVSEVRAELADLLALGLVYREQEGREIRWFLG